MSYIKNTNKLTSGFKAFFEKKVLNLPANMVKKYNNLNPQAKTLWKIRTIGWGFPMMLVPSLRFAQDTDKTPKVRKELFLRDFSSYAVGVGIYFGTLLSSQNAMKLPKFKNMPKAKQFIIPELLASGVFCMWSGILAPKFSNLYMNRKAAKKELAKNNIELMKNTKVTKPLSFVSRKSFNPNSAYTRQLYSSFRI